MIPVLQVANLASEVSGSDRWMDRSDDAELDSAALTETACNRMKKKPMIVSDLCTKEPGAQLGEQLEEIAR